ncbi:ASCH domain-containing protein [Anaeroselena agilis]|uniref:ASCH domain-containing protein n=1 Tax=Anaeroselena agilis TaxID=3063788 RepID=A0ABU3NWG0_9FIRM|nr:ASCH domain-containing protein [Selenomonadales bacterium 4137-cl]
MKALTLWEPWASLIALGAKRIETRSWPTNYRGPIAIHAAKSRKFWGLVAQEPFTSAATQPTIFHPGCVIAIADLVACIEMTPQNIAMVDEPERSFGHYEPGRFMWLLANVRRIDPVPATGRQRIWEWEGPINFIA